MKNILFALVLVVSAKTVAADGLPPLLDPAVTHALAEEVSGETAKRSLEEIARHHRMRGSREFRAASEHIETVLRRSGLSEIEWMRFPADGKIFYGTQRSRPPWNVELAELWESRPDGDVRIASWDAMPMRLAQDSVSADVTAELVDVGSGTSDADYSGKEVRGKIVLTSSQPGSVARLAVERYGAAGILSYAQNQRTAWWGENENLVRWGHLDTFATTRTFAFMLSLKEARAFQRRLTAGETVRLRARVVAGQEPGAYEILTATIPGSDPKLREQEIVFSCHLDHPRPGANDNASGCAAILEVARTYSKLIREEKLAVPARTIRFVWPPEIEGTMAFLTGRPETAARIRAAIHLDMVGGSEETKSIFHVTRGPESDPSFIHDLAQEIGAWVNEQTATYAKTGSARYSLHAPTGGKEPLRAELVDLTLGSDHQIYSEGSWGIPAIYLNDWPDRYIHTTGDVPGNIDPTKLRRAAFIAAASGWILANFEAKDVAPTLELLRQNALRRTADVLRRRGASSEEEAANLVRFHLERERKLAGSIERFAPLNAEARSEHQRFLDGIEQLAGTPARRVQPSGDGAIVYQRTDAPKGPMSVFGYDYLEDHFGEEKTEKLELLRISGGRRGSGSDYAYEALNLVDGKRTVQGIRDELSAIYGPVALEAVVEYLGALESIRILERIN